MATHALLVASYHTLPRRADIYAHVQRMSKTITLPDHIYEYTVPNLVGWYIAIPDVPAQWEAMDKANVSRYFSIMPNAMPWQNDATRSQPRASIWMGRPMPCLTSRSLWERMTGLKSGADHALVAVSPAPWPPPPVRTD